MVIVLLLCAIKPLSSWSLASTFVCVAPLQTFCASLPCRRTESAVQMTKNTAVASVICATAK